MIVKQTFFTDENTSQFLVENQNAVGIMAYHVLQQVFQFLYFLNILPDPASHPVKVLFQHLEFVVSCFFPVKREQLSVPPGVIILEKYGEGKKVPPCH
ncbi:hypothetical protein [Aminivibrio sp.]|uniref:hypothetical protein n=1 Tax=Aminivibrio sp. TaxID=1872489 RepID=UPI003D96D5A9